MAVLSDVEKRLKLTFAKRVKKMIKLRRRMRLWGAAGAACAVIASAPLAWYLLTGGTPPVSFDNALALSEDWATAIGAVAVGLFGTMLFYSQFKRDKDKLDKLKAGAVELIQAGSPICECKWNPCSCKDELAREMNEKFDINLFY